MIEHIVTDSPLDYNLEYKIKWDGRAWIAKAVFPLCPPHRKHRELFRFVPYYDPVEHRVFYPQFVSKVVP